MIDKKPLTQAQVLAVLKKRAGMRILNNVPGHIYAFQPPMLLTLQFDDEGYLKEGQDFNVSTDESRDLELA